MWHEQYQSGVCVKRTALLTEYQMFGFHAKRVKVKWNQKKNWVIYDIHRRNERSLLKAIFDVVILSQQHTSIRLQET